MVEVAVVAVVVEAAAAVSLLVRSGGAKFRLFKAIRRVVTVGSHRTRRQSPHRNPTISYMRHNIAYAASRITQITITINSNNINNSNNNLLIQCQIARIILVMIVHCKQGHAHNHTVTIYYHNSSNTHSCRRIQYNNNNHIPPIAPRHQFRRYRGPLALKSLL